MSETINVTILPNPKRKYGTPCSFIKAGPATVTTREPDEEDEFNVEQGDNYGYVHKDYVAFATEPWKPNNPIAFEDVKVGDQIAVKRHYSDDAYWVGTVSRAVPGFIVHSSGTFYRDEDNKFHLLHRPEAPKPELPTEIGAIITNATIRGKSGHSAVRIAWNEWRSFAIVNGTIFHLDEQVTEWEPGTVVPVTK